MFINEHIQNCCKARFDTHTRKLQLLRGGIKVYHIITWTNILKSQYRKPKHMANMLKERRAEHKHAWSDTRHVRNSSTHSSSDRTESETVFNKQFQKKSNK